MKPVFVLSGLAGLLLTFAVLGTACSSSPSRGVGGATGQPGEIVINEVYCRGEEFVEVANSGDDTVDLTNFALGETEDRAVAMPLSGQIAPGARASFQMPGLACDQDEAVLFDGATVVDRVQAPLAAADASFARLPDTSGPFGAASPTPAAKNTPWVDQARRLFLDLDEPVPATLPQLRITLDSAAEASLDREPRTFVEASLEFEDREGRVGPLSVGIRLKGQSVFRTLDMKAAFKLDTDRFEDGSYLLGVEKLTLNNFIQDQSGSHERMYYGLLARSELAGPRVGYVEVFVNGESYGVYLALESSDETGFLGRSFASTALLYEGEYGADLYLYQEFDEDYGDDPDRSTLNHVIEDFNDAGDASLMQETADTLDWDHVQGQMAADIFAGHYDSYTANRNNFTFQIDDEGRLALISGGADQTFEQEVELDVEGGLILKRCLAQPACADQLDEKLQAIAENIDGWLDGGGRDRLTEDAATLERLFNDDARIEWNAGELPRLVDEMIAFIEDRIATFR
jgi:hypothetical protein